MKYIFSIVLAATLLCGCSKNDEAAAAERQAQAEKIASLEKDVKRLKSEVRDLRRRMEVAPKAPKAPMRQGARRPQMPQQIGERRVAPDDLLGPVKAQEELKNLDAKEKLLRERKGKLTKEERRQLHAERRRLHMQRRAEREAREAELKAQKEQQEAQQDAQQAAPNAAQ